MIKCPKCQKGFLKINYDLSIEGKVVKDCSRRIKYGCMFRNIALK